MATPHTTVSRTITLTLAFVALTSASLPLFAGPTRKAKVTPAKAKVAAKPKQVAKLAKSAPVKPPLKPKAAAGE